MPGIFGLFRKREEENTNAPTHVLAGLGNPGREYALTRHNVGFLALDYISEKLGAKTDRSKFDSLYGTAEISGKKVVLLRPLTYMNGSGVAVRKCVEFYKIPVENVIVISDDVNLPVGRMRVRGKGSDGGQKGLADIIYQLRSDCFPRVRIGTGLPEEKGYDLARWVLSEIPEGDREIIFGEFERAFRGIEYIIGGRIDKAIELCNSGGNK